MGEREKRYKYIDENRVHLHTLDNIPLTGTSSIMDVLGKNLTWWAAEWAAVECLEAGEKIPTIREEYLAACSQQDKKSAIDLLQEKYPIFKDARFAHFNDRNKKAKKGTNLHADLERFVNDQIEGKEGVYPEQIQSFIEWSKKNVKKWLWSEKHSYSERLWVGGISDAGAILNDDSVALFDFKSANKAFFNHFLQCAGYALEIEENGLLDPNGNFIMSIPKIDKLLVVPFGAEVVEPVEYKGKLDDLKKGFEYAVGLYRLMGLDKQ